MILSKELYIRASFFKRLWLKKQLSGLAKSSRIFAPGAWRSYQPSFRSRSIPRFIGSKSDLAQFSNAKDLETICPTGAITVTLKDIRINEKNCIGCQECVKASPEGFFEASPEKFLIDPDTN